MNKSLQHQNNTQHPPWRQLAQTCQDIDIFSNFAFVLQFVKFSYNAQSPDLDSVVQWGFGNSLLIVHLEFDALLMLGIYSAHTRDQDLPSTLSRAQTNYADTESEIVQVVSEARD